MAVPRLGGGRRVSLEGLSPLTGTVPNLLVAVQQEHDLSSLELSTAQGLCHWPLCASGERLPEQIPAHAMEPACPKLNALSQHGGLTSADSVEQSALEQSTLMQVLQCVLTDNRSHKHNG